MPVTPFHFGPASVVKAVAPGGFSFVAFGLSQVVIDLEPLFYMSQGVWPIHRFLHTYLGATLAAVLVVGLGRPLCEAVLRLWNLRLSAGQRAWLGVDPQITVTAAATGALFGAWSHVLLDSMMHADMRPLSPLSDSNGLLHVMSIGWLHVACAAAGVAGGGWLLITVVRRKLAVVRRDT